MNDDNSNENNAGADTCTCSEWAKRTHRAVEVADAIRTELRGAARLACFAVGVVIGVTGPVGRQLARFASFWLEAERYVETGER